LYENAQTLNPLFLAADWASERQANIAQPKRMSAGQSHQSSARCVGRDFLSFNIEIYFIESCMYWLIASKDPFLPP